MTQFIARSLPSSDRDDERGVLAPRSAPLDLFLSASHDLFTVGALHRAQADAFNKALNGCSSRRRAAVLDALTVVRDRAERIAVHCAALQDKLTNADDFEDSNQVYGA